MLTAKKRRTYPDLPSEQALEKAKVEVMQFQPLAEKLFPEAAQFWFNEHRRYIAARTQRDYRQYIVALLPFFGKCTMRDIHIGHLREYQDWRAQSACNTRINMELSTVQQILKEANLWSVIAPLYKPLPVPREGAGRAMTPEEERRMYAACFRRPRRMLADHCVVLMRNTGCGFGEVRQLRRRHVDLKERLIYIIEGAKNGERVRPVPLNGHAFASVQWIVARYEDIGGKSPDDFVLPHRSNKGRGLPDFTKAITSIYGAFQGLMKDAEIEGYRLYDVARVTPITRALSSGKIPVHTAQKLFGHVSQAMQRRYYKPHLDALRSAVSVLEDAC